MRLLQIHADKFCYEPTEAATEERDEAEPGEVCLENSLVAFVTVEEGDSEAEAAKAAELIVEHAKTVKASGVVVYPYAHLSSRLASPRTARRLLQELAAKLGELGVPATKAPFGWYKKFLLEAKGHPLSELSRSVAAGQERRAEPLVEAFGGAEELLEYLKRFGVEVLGDKLLVERHALEAVSSVVAARCSSVLHAKELPEEPAPAGACIQFSASLALEKKVVFYSEVAVPSSSEELARLFSCRAQSVHEESKRVVLEGSSWRAAAACRVNGTYYLNALAAFVAAVACEADRVKRGETPILPFWLSPVQAYVATAGHVEPNYLELVESALKSAGLRYVVDAEQRPLGAKIREGGRLWAPILIVVGPREVETGTVALRYRHSGLQEVVDVRSLKDALQKAVGAGYCSA